MSVRTSTALAPNGEALPDDHELQVRSTPIDQIHPYRNNPREHPRNQIEKLKKSVLRDGVVQPLVIDEQGEIIAGHAVYLAAKQLAFTELPTITLRNLSETDKRRLRIALNKLGDLSRFSSEILKGEVLAILADEPLADPEELGFEVGEWDQVVHADTDIDDDRLPNRPAKPLAQPGDIWILDEHLIGCGDARDSDFLSKVMADTVADVAFLDIPYNVSIAGHATRSGQHGEFRMASGEMSEDEYMVFVRETLGRAVNCSRDGGVHFICIDHHHIDQLMAAAKALYGSRLHICVWNKSNAGLGSFYRSKHEFVVVYRVGDAQPINNVQLGRYGRSRTSVWDYPSVNMVGTSRAAELKWHATTKPVALVADAIKDVTKPGDVVLDTFLGSGTTLIAAERVGRRCRGVEIEPHYIDIAIERWVAITGGKPVLHYRAEAEPARAEATASIAAWGKKHG